LDRFWQGWDTESQIDIQPRKNYNLFNIDILLYPHPLAVMNKLKLLKLAKQGNCEAISTLLSRQLKTKEIIVKVFIKQGCLNIILESNTVPNQESWGKLISNLIDYLGLTFIEQVKVSAKKPGENIPEWSQTFELIQKSKVDHVFFRDTIFNNPLKQLEKIGEKAIQDANQKINQSVDEITNTVFETSQNLVGKITDTSNQIQEITSKSLDQTVQKISEVQTTASQSIIETVDEITNTFSQTYQNLSEKITDTSNQIQETTSKNLDQTVQKISEVQTVISDGVIETTEQLQKNASQTVREIQNLGKNTHKVVKNTASSFNSFLSKWSIDKNTPVLPYGFFAVAFINEGKTVICSKGDGSVIFWNWLNSKLVKIGDDKQQNFVEFRCHQKTITAFDVSLNEKFLVTSSENEPIKLWDLINRKIICTFGDQSNSVQVIKFSPNSELLASAEADNQIKIWNIKSQLEIKNLSIDVNSIRCLCFSENGKFLAGASDDGSIKIWNLSTGKIVRSFPGHNGGTHCILFNSTKQIIISGGHDCLIKIWDVKTGNLIYEMNGHEAAITCLAISSDQKNLVSGSFDKTIKIWNFNKKKLIFTINNHSKVITSLAFSPTNKILASSSIDESVKVWDINFLNNKSKLWIKFSVGILFSVIVFSFNLFILNNNNKNQCLNFLLECINQTSYGTAIILFLNITFILSVFISLTILFKIYSSPLRAILSVVKIPIFMMILVILIQISGFLFLGS
jgi:WD40 repeat protein